MPTEDDRFKQLVEISILLKAQPIPATDPMGQPILDPMTGQPQMHSSVPVDPELDNHMIEAQTCRTFLISEDGLDAKINNEAGYMNVRAHMLEHLNIMRSQMPGPVETGAAGGETSGANPNPPQPPGNAPPGLEPMAPVQ